MRASAWIVWAVVVTSAERALADQPSMGDPHTVAVGVDESKPPLGLLPSPDNLIDPSMSRSWGAAPPRPFVSTAVDVGWVYLRPRVSLGYGRPFTSWIGVDANPLVQTAGMGAYGGARFALPYGDLRLGSRYFYSFPRSYLVPKTRYTYADLNLDTGKQASIVTHEAELTINVPAGPGDILLLGSASIVTGVPSGRYVFEETLHTIVNPPYVWRVRTGYSLRFGESRQHSIGLVAELLDVPRRDDSLTVRAGPVVRIVLSRRVEVRGSFVLAVFSPDQIGVVGGDFTELGVRYRWATE
jgi:hypothetical protein